MMMVDVTSIDSVPGESELLAHAAHYMAERLFTPRQRKSLRVQIEVTRQPQRVPVTRAMLGPQKAGLGTKPPTLFTLTVSTSGGIRDAAETIAHEMLHISQAVNGRLLITRKKARIGGRKTMVDKARWMGGKPLVMDNLAWNLRPWEIEACHWQTRLVDEFLGLSTGQVTDQPIQSPKRRQLALYPVNMASLVTAPTPPEPTFDGVAMGADAAPAATTPTIHDQTPAPHKNGDHQTGDHQNAALAAPVLDGMQMPDRQIPDSQISDTQIPDTQMTDTQMTDSGVLPVAMPDRPVYPRPVIEVTVPGLDAPRVLEREAMIKKLSEFRERGLAAADTE